MDIKMPIMDGITLASKIREFDLNIPIIALSANAYDHDIERSIEVGMNAHLSKPFDREVIYSEIKQQL